MEELQRVSVQPCDAGAMKCAICERPLFKTAIMIGSEAIGPKCFRKVFGVFPKSQKNVRRVQLKETKPDKLVDTTMDLFGEDE